MLHEIFKGMDNAAEQINENFLKGSIVEDNLDETNPKNGYYVRFGNGFQLCWGEVRASYYNSSNLDGRWTLPAEFINDRYFADAVNLDIPTSNNNSEARMSETATYVRNTNNTSFRKIAPVNTFASGDYVDLLVFAFGKYK